MPWVYSISRHTFSFPGLPDETACYSGGGVPPLHTPADVNNPMSCGVPNYGPIPPGTWEIAGLMNSPTTGPETIVLSPDEGTRQLCIDLKRDADSFRIHGDSIESPGEASEGCIIAPRDFRVNLLWGGVDKTLIVVP